MICVQTDDLPLDAKRRLRLRLLPLSTAAALQGFMLWVPVEKLFMTEIGFDAASIGLMAAAYAALVPVIEIPSGILADRWSRRGVLVIAAAALGLTSLIGGLSHDVPTYIGSALVLAVYFAMYSGTMDAVVYDTVLEEIGASDRFEQEIGRVRAVESAALVAGALAGGWLAGLASPRATFFLTVPFALASVAMLLRFREPRLHKEAEMISLRAHLATTFQAVVNSRRLVPIVACAAVTALILSTLFEFGPLWLLAADAAPAVYGPYWAALTATLGFGGLLAGRLALERTGPQAAVIGILIAASCVLAGGGLLVVVAAQVVLVLLVLILSIRATQLLNDSVPSAIRAGVGSAVGALGWLIFLPFAFGFGLVSRNHGVDVAAWLLVGAVTAACVALIAVGRVGATVASLAEDLTSRLLRDVRRCLVERRQAIEPLDCVEVVELITEFLDRRLDPHAELAVVNHLRSCEGCAGLLQQVERTIAELRALPAEEKLAPDAKARLMTAFSRSLA